MQNVSFKNVDEFLEFLPQDERKIVDRLRQCVIDCIPDYEEKLSFNVPYYKKHSNICFIWPGSVAWGNVKQRGVRLGFTSGNLLQDDLNYLDKGKRRQVYWKDFYDVKDIDFDILRAYIFDAVLIDRENAKQKIK